MTTEPLWSDKRIGTAFISVANDDGEVGADEIMFVVKGIRDEYEAKIAELESKLADAFTHGYAVASGWTP